MSFFCDPLLSLPSSLILLMSFLCHPLLPLTVLSVNVQASQSILQSILSKPVTHKPKSLFLIFKLQIYYFLSFKLHNCMMYCIFRYIVEGTVIVRWEVDYFLKSVIRVSFQHLWAIARNAFCINGYLGPVSKIICFVWGLQPMDRGSDN